MNNALSRRSARMPTIALLSAVLLAGAARAAFAGGFAVKVEPAAVFPLTQPQSRRFDTGGGVAAKALLGICDGVDLTAGLSAFALPASSSSPVQGAGIAWTYGPGVRLRAGSDPKIFHGASPWADADALYIRTGSLNRYGFALGAGLAFPVGDARKLWAGPFVRYQQVAGTGGSDFDSRDAKVLFAGLSLEFGASRQAAAVKGNAQ